MEECIESKKDLEDIIGPEWKAIVTSEKLKDLEIKEKEEDTRFYKATPSVGTTKSYATLVRESSEVEVQEKPYKPTHSPKVKRRIFGEESEQPKADKGERRSSRIKTKV